MPISAQAFAHIGFQIIYDGLSLLERLMDTRNLAPALLSLFIRVFYTPYLLAIRNDHR
jgi:hypothetical protein